MKNIRIFCLLITFIAVSKCTYPTVCDGGVQNIYEVMQSEDTAKINAALAEIEISSVREKNAYKGSLLMKKSALIHSGMDKLSVFKQGRKLLEASINQDSTNAEYRFLRLMIQEHAPDFLNYHSKKEADAKLIMESYAALPLQLKEAIKKYSKNSHILKPENFQK
jgi:hypothetical protein